jgi:PAS domain S-box-containing protein
MCPGCAVGRAAWIGSGVAAALAASAVAVFALRMRKRSEQQLRGRDELFRSIVEALPALVGYVDRDLRCKFVNRAYRSWTGRPPEELLGRLVPDVMDASSMAIAEPHFQRVLAGETVRYEIDVPFPDGTLRCLDIAHLPHLVDGKTCGFVALVQDVTERRRTVDALRESEAQYRASFERVGAGRAEADYRSGRFLQVNRRLCEITGYSDEELLARTLSDITHRDDLVTERLGLLELGRQETGECQMENRYVRKDGSVVWVHVNVSMIRTADGRPLRTVFVMQDATSRRRAEATLRASEEHQRLAVQAADLGVWHWDLRSEPWRGVWNDRLLAMAGLTPGMYMTPERFVDLLHPDERERVFAGVQRAISEHSDYRDEFRVVHPDGTVSWISWTGRVLYAVDGTPERMIGVALDVTDRKRAEETQREADHRKDEFLAMLAHELRNPLVPIRNAVRLLQLIGSREPQCIEAQAMIDRQVTHMVRLIDDLLDVSRITRGAIILRRKVVAVARCIEQAVEQARPITVARGQMFTVSSSCDGVWIHVDPTRLVQVLDNLLANASKFTPPGGEISLTAERSGDDEVVIRVRDTGVGIAPDVLPRVFDLFFQEEDAIDRSQGGLGIGLTLVKTLVELHGGHVDVRSAGRGMGTEFVLTLRCLPPALRLRPASPTSRVPAVTRPMRLLIVEDNVDVALSFQRLLKIDGHEVRLAHDGMEALEIVLSYTPDVAFIDIGLPRIDGYELARRLRQMRPLGATVLIALSGYGREADKRRALEAGFDQHMTKPIDCEIVEALLASLGAVEPSQEVHVVAAEMTSTPGRQVRPLPRQLP